MGGLSESDVAAKKTRRLPDTKWLRKEVAIADVANALGIPGDDRVFDCFRETHPSGKPRRSLSVHGRSNTVRCFSCDTRQLSTIDLVMAIRCLDVGDAIKWLAERFPDVPMVKVRPSSKIKPLMHYKTEMTLHSLIHSPGWVSLGSSAKIVLASVFSRVPATGREQFAMRCTYSDIENWSGLGRASVARALSELRKAKAIQTSIVGTGKRMNRGFWLKELYIRISPRAMRPGAPDNQLQPVVQSQIDTGSTPSQIGTIEKDDYDSAQPQIEAIEESKKREAQPDVLAPISCGTLCAGSLRN